MDKWLLKKAGTRFVGAFLGLSLLLFVPAGTLKFPGAWRLMLVLFVPMLVMGLYLLKNKPEELERRLSHREMKKEQRQVLLYVGILLILAFLLAGFNWRFHWIVLPSWVSRLFCLVLVLGYWMFARVLRENPYSYKSLQLQKRQRLVDTGLYAVVRHPMYLSTALMFLSIPLILCSFLSFVVMLLYLPLLEWRIREEESLLEEGLPGYLDYEDRVRYKVIPYFW